MVFPRDLVVAELPERPVGRAALAVEVRGTLVVLDAETREFVRLPRPVPEASFRSLSADGSRMLLVKDSARSRGGICALTLADGEEQWFATPDERSDQDAMLSPDGTVIATLADSGEEDPGHAVIGVLDPVTGCRRDLWRAEGAASWESGLCWSPDGRWIAATYMIWDVEYDDDALSTVIVDAENGAVRIGPIIRSSLLGNTHSPWVDDDRLAFRRECMDVDQLFVVDVERGEETPGPEFVGHPWGIIDGRFVYQLSSLERWDPEASTFYTTNLDNADRSTLFVIRPRAEIKRFQLALRAFPEALRAARRSTESNRPPNPADR
ncbi:hypothetical protein Sru01_58060 [Sphaerisporangium rufum]|uniref:Uncharacterized protein n=1 Tax=Sphaerisporangium rufum TaxID=1381558 RepID=A0A919R7C5_9ACTN|nr:hypothetical protein [Sphaerisporangium rufum]GII80824.1 hypothetical protein Sru01_58060 [Sphaerisporangium rufum]